VQFVGSALTIAVPTGYVGTFDVSVTVADPFLASATQTFTVLADTPPELAAIPNQVFLPGQPRQIQLSASDADNDPLSYSAVVIRAEERAYQLDQSLGLSSDGNFSTNWGGRNEKWIRGNGSAWYFILPSGELYRWNGSNAAAGTPVATLDERYHANPSLLYNAPDPASVPGPTVHFAGSRLTITDTTGYSWPYQVSVTVTDLVGASDSETFFVYTGSPPELAPVSDQVTQPGESIVVELSASDPDDDGLSYAAVVISMEDVAYEATATLRRTGAAGMKNGFKATAPSGTSSCPMVNSASGTAAHRLPASSSLRSTSAITPTPACFMPRPILRRFRRPRSSSAARH
jgi:hypothetical protein